jgi:hypothetical protein
MPVRMLTRCRLPLFTLMTGLALWAGSGVVRSILPAGDGLLALYYDNPDWKSWPVFSAVDAEPSTAQVVRRWNNAPPVAFSVVWTGYLSVVRSGLYDFATTSDDGSRLFIDDQLVVDNGGPHANTTRSGGARLNQGAHRVRLEFFQAGGDFGLSWSWARDGGSYSTVPAWALSQRPVHYQTVAAARLVDFARPVTAILALFGAIWCVVVALDRSAEVAVLETGLFAAAGIGLPLLLIVHAIRFWGRGIVDQEAAGFVVTYLAKRPVLATIFDPRLTEYGAFQARELSYVFDYVDARIFAALLDRHVLSFIPVSGALGLIAAAVIYLYGTRRVLGLDGVTAGLLLSVFLSCIVTQASTAIFYRSAKIVLTVALLAFLFQLTYLLREENGTRRTSVWKLAGLFLLGLVMSVSDRQGFFYLVIATGIVAMLWMKGATRRPEHLQSTYRRVGATGVCAIAAAMLYNDLFAPGIIRWANGYWPDFAYQQLPFSRLDWTLGRHALQMFTAQVSYFFGNAPFMVVCAVSVAFYAGSSWRDVSVAFYAGGSWCERWTQTHRAIKRLLVSDVLLVLLVSSAAMVVLIGLMIIRHPPVFSIPDHSLWYYTLTMQAALLFGATLCVSQASGARGMWGRPAICVLLLLMIASNAAHYGAQRKAMIGSMEWFGSQYVSSQNYSRQFEAMESSGPADHVSRSWIRLGPTGASVDSSQSWIRLGPGGAIVELPIERTGFLDAVQAAHATLVGRPPLADASGPDWNTLGDVLLGAASPLNDPTQIPSAVEAFQSVGVRQIVLNRDRYQNPEVARETAEAVLAATGSILKASDDGRVLTLDLVNDRVERPDEQASRRIPPQVLRITAGTEAIRIDLDRFRPVRRIRMELTERGLVDYPRTLIIEAVDGAQVRTLYNASPLGAVMRALLARPAQASIEIGLPPNRSRTLVLRQPGQNPSWKWAAHELTLFETDEKSQ